jgi:hypothetical protein
MDPLPKEPKTPAVKPVEKSAEPAKVELKAEPATEKVSVNEQK